MGPLAGRRKFSGLRFLPADGPATDRTQLAGWHRPQARRRSRQLCAQRRGFGFGVGRHPWQPSD
jgi:hypothetical protein